MIVRSTSRAHLLVRQSDHARLAGEIIGLLRHPELLEHPRRRELLRALSEHDNGWWEEDAAPRLDPDTGAPLDFRRLPAAVRRELSLRAVERYAVAEPYVAALVAGHHLRLASASGPSGDDALSALLDARRGELLAASGSTSEEAAADDRWLRLGDELSLVAATLEDRKLGAPGWKASSREIEAGVELAVAPFLWAGTTSLTLECRRLPLFRYDDSAALGRTWITTPRERLVIRLQPL